MTKLLLNGIEVKTFTFSGGEVNPRVPEGIKAPFHIKAWLQNSDDIMNLLMLHDAIKRQYGKEYLIGVTVPYLPYARQDRVCTAGEAIGLHTMLDILDRFSSIHTFDIHNEEAVNTDKLVNVYLHHILGCNNEIVNRGKYILVAPDKGATEKVEALTDGSIVYGSKLRDPETGKLSGFSYTTDIDCEGQDLLLVDDICDGGGTFIGLAEKLKELKPRSMTLYVTHGIFSKGIEDLLKVFDKIITTDTFIHPYVDDERITTIKVV